MGIGSIIYCFRTLQHDDDDGGDDGDGDGRWR